MAKMDVAAIAQLVDEVDSTSLSTEERVVLQNAAKALQKKTSTPWDLWFRLVYEQPALLAAIKVCSDLELFQKWNTVGGGSKTAPELVSIAGKDCDPELLERMLRLLVATGLLDSPSAGTYTQTAFTESFRDATSAAIARYAFDVNLPLFKNLPDFLASTAYRNPADMQASNFNSALARPGTIFDWLKEQPAKLADFNLVMKLRQANTLPWTDVYPTEQLLQNDDDPSVPLLVDIGGSIGHDIALFAAKHPAVPPARLILQDLPDVLAKARVGTAATPMPHDFFTPQPVKGARAYFMHSILHDWADERARSILRHVRDAMAAAPRRSRLLLFEMIVHADHPNKAVPVVDLMVMASLSALERTAEKWNALVESVGLKIRAIHFHPLALSSVMEITVADVGGEEGV